MAATRRLMGPHGVSAWCLVLVAGLLATWGMSMIARPSWHLARRVIRTMQARDLWRSVRHCPLPPGQGEPAIWLRSPDIGLDCLVLWSWDEDDLLQYPCWYPDGQGNQTPHRVFGHRDAHFRKLQNIQLGDSVWMEMRGGEEAAYRVGRTQVVDAARLEAALALGHSPDWVLVTCYPFRYIGPAPRRFLVWLEPVPDSSGSR